MVFAFLGTPTIIVILIIALLVFGPEKLPEIGKQVGTAMRELNKVRQDVQKALELDEFTNPLSFDNYNHDTYDTTHNTANALPHYESPQGVTHAAASTSGDAHYPHFGVNDTLDNGGDAAHVNAQIYHSGETGENAARAFAAPPGPKGSTLSASFAAETPAAPQETV